MAGAIALIYAARYPVRGVVDIDNPLDVRPFAALIKQLEPALRGPSFADVFAPIQDSMGLDLVPEPLRSLALDAQRVSRDVALGYFEELMRSDPDELQAWIEEIAGAIAVPSLLLFGQRLSREERDYTLAHLPLAQIDEWDGRGHFVHLAEADRFAARLRTFIDHCESPGNSISGSSASAPHDATRLPLPADLKTVEINGARMAYREQGSGEAVVFVHGSISDLTIWEPQLAPVGERYQAIAYSRRYAWPNRDLPRRRYGQVRWCGGQGPRAVWWCERRSSLYRLVGGRTRRNGRPAAGAQVREGPSGGQTRSGASRSGSGSEGLVAGEHVPDRFGELSGDVDLGDLGAALLTQATLVALVALAVDGVLEGVHGRFEHRPAQVLGSLFGQRAAAVFVAGLVHARTQAGVAARASWVS